VGAARSAGTPSTFPLGGGDRRVGRSLSTGLHPPVGDTYLGSGARPRGSVVRTGGTGTLRGHGCALLHLERPHRILHPNLSRCPVPAALVVDRYERAAAAHRL